MARRKATPETSKLARSQPIAFARRGRTGDAGGADDDDPDDKSTTAPAATKPTTAPDDIPTQPITPLAAAKAEAEAAAKSDAKPDADEPADRKTLQVIVPPDRKAAEPWPDATPEPMRPVEVPTRSRSETLLAPQLPQDFGRPPDMPKTSAPPPLALGSVEDPTHMPGPRELPSGNPDDPAPPPGRVPPGDSRSLRSGNQFALIYRVGTYVISRFGTVGTRGQWRVVEYPTSSSASHSYAKECSRFVSEGYSDYRD